MEQTSLILFTLSIFFLCINAKDICTVCNCSASVDVVKADCNGVFSKNFTTNDLLSYNQNNTKVDLILSNNDNVNSTHMKTVDMSHNKIQNSNYSLMKTWDQLVEINLSFNNLSVLDVELILKFPSILKGNWSHNAISDVKQSSTNISTPLNLTNLDLSYNELIKLSNSTFHRFSKLQYLNLSFNLINSIHNETFAALINLEILNLENNRIQFIKEIIFPKYLKQLYLGNKQLSTVPQIYISNSTDNKTIVYQNFISDFFNNTKFLSLEFLDISFNNFTSVPEALSQKNFPQLHTLIMSGNPISILKFPSRLRLGNLVMNNMIDLVKIDDNAFSNLTTNHEISTIEFDNHNTKSLICMNISISSNKKLETFNEQALYNIKNFSICLLDLSDNQFSYFHLNLSQFNATPIINLQRNPIICNCSMQWILNDLVPNLNSTKNEFLDDLRCSGPEDFANMRMVHWLGNNQQVFCNPPKESSSTENITVGLSSGYLVAIIISLIVLCVLIVIGIQYSQKIYYKRVRQNRRY